MSKKALIITWSGFQDHELVYPYYRLLGAGFETTIVGVISKRKLVFG